MMKNSILSFFLVVCLFSSCRQVPDSNLQTELEGLQTQLQQKTTDLANLRKEMSSIVSAQQTPLVHLVFLKVKDDISAEDKTALMNTLKRLADIAEVKNLHVGDFEDLGDERALSDYDVVMQMGFQTKEDYQKYQADERHIQAKAAMKPFLAGPPATYDFVVE
ncbi:MAG: Dabb family protein [Chitinophagales bacterium]